LENVDEAIGLEYLVPEVMRLPVALHGRVARAMIIASVEWQED